MRHGNEDTFREMLRIKRSVQAQFSTQVNFVSVQMLAAAAGQEATNKTGKVSEVCICVHVCNFEIDMLKFVLIQYRKYESEKLGPFPQIQLSMYWEIEMFNANNSGNF